MSGLFSTPKIPEPEKPAPLPDEEQLAKARRRRVAKEKNTSGADSTILSSGKKETLGG